MIINIAIDGPAGAGKSTIAKKSAKELAFIYVDTGAMYRAMAYYMLQQGIAPEDKAGIEEACQHADITISYVDGEQQVLLNGENVNPYIRTEAVGNMASATSVNGKVRAKLVALQQKLASEKSVVMDGRDIGTTVLPKAQLKIYLTASSATRAKRRYDELTAKCEECDLQKIEEDMIDRDYRYMHREISPLKQAEDAVYLDSSDMNIEEVVNEIMKLYRKVV